MAFLAGNRCVQPDQGKICQVMIEHYILVPALFVMAIATLLTLLSSVYICKGMAGDTISLQALFVQWAAVTNTTGQLSMPAHERKFRIALVVKTDFTPAGFPMAITALLSVPASMRIVRLMTVYAQLAR